MTIVEFYQSLGVTKEKTAQFLAENTRTVRRRKGYPLRTAGDDLKTLLFHLDGIIRCAYIDDEGRESVLGFLSEPGPCIGTLDLEGPIHMNVETVTAATVLELPKSALEQALKMDTTLYETIIKQMAEIYKQDFQWQIAMKTMDSHEKYRWFLERYGDIADDVTQKDAANFLNVTPQTLCRVKRTLGK